MKKKKKRLIIIICVVAGLLALTLAAYFILGAIAGREPDYGYEFYEPDYEADIMEDEDYISAGWYITYTNDMGESVTIMDDNYLKYGIGMELFSYYFASVQSGDADTYNSLFGGDYYSSNKEKEPFTPQRIYDIKVRFLNEDELDDGTAVLNYEVQYKIMRNDGTFRRDIGSDMSRTQYFTIYSGENGTYINGVGSSFRK